MYERSLSISEKALGAEHPEVAKVLNNLALLYNDLGDDERSLELYERSLSISEKALGAEHPLVAITLSNLASLYDDERSLELYERALAIEEKALGAEHPLVATTLSNLALLYDDERSLELYERALAIQEKALGMEHPLVATTLYNLAYEYETKGQIAEAITFSGRALDIEENGLISILTMGSEQQKQSYMESLRFGTDRVLSLHCHLAVEDLDAAQLALQTTLRRKGRVLDAQADTYRNVRQNLNPEGLKLLDALMKLRTQEANLVLRGLADEEPSIYRSKLEGLSKQIDEAERSLAGISAAFESQNQPITVDVIASQLPKNISLLEIVQYKSFDAKEQDRFKQHYGAYLLHPDGHIDWTGLGPVEPLNDMVRQLRAVIAAGATGAPFPRALAASLYTDILGPFQSKLTETRHLLIAPDGLLNLLPFEALVGPEGRYLVEDVQLTYLTSGRDMMGLELKHSARSGPLVIADPDYDLKPGEAADVQLASRIALRGLNPGEFQWSRLPGTADEAALIHPLLKGSRLLTGVDATENALKSVEAPKILHIATHGIFQEQESESEDDNALLRSAVILAGANNGAAGNNDGYLTASEAMSLDLLGTQLVVLSACETGVGEIRSGQGVYGLRRALVLAGAESQVMSLWAVGDEGTQTLMTDYYGLLVAGEERSAALRQVKLSMLSTEKFAHPFFWAAFIFSGDWRALDNEP